MNTNRKVYAVLFFNIAAVVCACLFYALPRMRNIITENLLPGQGILVTDQALQALNRECLVLSVSLVLLAAALLWFSIYLTGEILRPMNTFINKIGHIYLPGGQEDMERTTAGIQAASSSAGLINSLPIGIMAVNCDGIIYLFNREAGEITKLDPSQVVGRPLVQFFPNNVSSCAMEVVNTGREYLGLRNIIKAGDFFRELLLCISPLRTGDLVTGAIAVFQDVTPQRKMIEVQSAYALARDLATQKDLDGTVRLIARSAAEMVNIEYTAVFLADENGRLTIQSSCGIPPEEVEKYNASPWHVNSPEIKSLYLNRVPLLHGDVRNKPDLSPLLILPGISSLYSFPIIYEDRLIGLLNLYSQDQNKLSKDMIYLIRSLSGQLNTAITNFYELQRMRALASVDGLTGLFNKKHFLQAVEAQLLKACASSPLSLIMLDIDHFKKINDSFGHQFGDRILKEVAGLISRLVRESDLVCRYGGEEFSVVMPGTSKEKALEAADRIRSGIESYVFYGPGKEPLTITVSGGVACFPEDASNADDLIMKSDTALYAAKRAGRNRISAYEPEQKLTQFIN
ncbi:MAG: diguanylate cyclase [Peptococcaceae bacterium]|nr:diguanylate cyclase [Peptococcaceae bacterium]